jgi:hypothetical protein
MRPGQVHLNMGERRGRGRKKVGYRAYVREGETREKGRGNGGKRER